MPAAIPAELKEKVKMLAFQIGVREAARQCNVPESTAQFWSWDEDWMLQKAQLEQTKALVIEQKGLQPLSTIDPAAVLGKLGSKSKLVQAKTLLKTAKGHCKLPVEQLITVAGTQAVKNNIDSSDKIFGYTTTPANLTQVNVNLHGYECKTVTEKNG